MSRVIHDMSREELLASPQLTERELLKSDQLIFSICPISSGDYLADENLVRKGAIDCIISTSTGFFRTSIHEDILTLRSRLSGEFGDVRISILSKSQLVHIVPSHPVKYCMLGDFMPA